MKRILLLGSGGREHALAWKIAQSPKVEKLFIAPGNAGTMSVGENVALKADDFDGIRRFVLENGVNMVVVGPEDPLVKGIYDYFKADSQLSSVPVIGPSRAGAVLEGSKEFAKGFMPVSMAICVLDQEAVGYWFVLIIIAPVFGHMYSALNGFRGGVGIATALGTLIAIFLDSRLPLVICAIYAIARFGMHFKKALSRTDFVFLAFLVCLQIIPLNPVYRISYSIISTAVLLRNRVLKAVYGSGREREFVTSAR
jgi:glycerol-3-phosphate acyltransferase PlsY